MCSIEKVPFRGVPCSDAAGKQKPYKWLMEQVNSSMSGRLWDDEQQAPYFNYKVLNFLSYFKDKSFFFLKYTNAWIRCSINYKIKCAFKCLGFSSFASRRNVLGLGPKRQYVQERICALFSSS